MNANEMGQAIKDMGKQDLDVIRGIVEERAAVIKRQEVETLMKTVAIGTWASYSKGTSEIVGEVVSMNKKSIIIEVQKGDRAHKKALAWEDVKKSYRTRPEGLFEQPGKNLKQPAK